MKKAIFSAIALLLVCVAFGQKTNTQIFNIIEMSKEYNSLHGIKNPDQVWPGQTLTFLFQDATWQQVVVEAGDNQWTIVRDKLNKLENVHGEIVSPVQDTLVPSLPQTQPVEDSVKTDPFMAFLLKMPWWFWLIMALFFIGLIGSLVEASKKKKEFKHSADPTKEGKPFVEGGVNAENAEEHFVRLIQEKNPGAVITVKNIKAGYLSTPNGLPAIVKFADKTSKNLTFRNAPGFSGEVSIDDKPYSLEYFFQGCGNPAYGRTSMKSGIIFSTQPINFGDELQPLVKATATEEATTEKTQKVVEKEEIDKKETIEVSQPQNPGSETFQVAIEHAMIVEGFLKTNVAHKVTMEYTTPEGGTVKTIFETKNLLFDKKAEEK